MESTCFTPSSFPLNATYGPSAFETGKYGNKFDFYANNTCPTTFDRTFVPSSTPFGVPTTTPFGVPSTYTPFAADYFRGVPSTPFEARFGVPSTWAAESRFYPSTWERTAFPSTWERSVYPTPYGYPSWALNAERIPSTWGVPSTWNNNTWSTPSTPFVNSTYCNVAFRPCHPVEFYSLSNPIRIVDREGNRMLWLCYELKGFKPEEITCTFNKAERCITVEAAHENKEGKEHHILRKFSRKFVLPESLAKCDLSKVELKSCLSNEGFLTIECCLPKMTAEEIARNPILSTINELPFYGRNVYGNVCPTEVINNVRPVTVKTA